MKYDVIIDCYTDEPSGLGVPPYLSVHSRYISGFLAEKDRKYYYLTIDDIRYSKGEIHFEKSFNKRILNTTKNKDNVKEILNKADNIFIVMGCFVKYDYVSAEPPIFNEVKEILKPLKISGQKILFYSLGRNNIPKKVIEQIIPQDTFDLVYFGNVYNYFLNFSENHFAPNYDKLDSIAIHSADILKQLERPLVIEIETSTGCNRKPGCTFCIEGLRGIPIEYRKIDSIVNEIKALYFLGARFFRLGKQPNFYAYMDSNPTKIKELLKTIRKECPDIKTLHIDNASPQNVATKNGKLITQAIVKYCTSANIAPLGVESFDEVVRDKCNLNGTVEDIHNSINIINKYGKIRGNDGIPKFLPGINIIYGLEEQNEKTLEKNLENFDKILNSNNFVRRVFVRKLTSPYGEQFDTYSQEDIEEFKKWKEIIEEKFSIPMLKKVYPVGLKLKNLRMEMYKDGDSILRSMGTCPERIIIRNKKLELDKFYDVKVVGYLGDRVILGELV